MIRVNVKNITITDEVESLYNFIFDCGDWKKYVFKKHPKLKKALDFRAKKDRLNFIKRYTSAYWLKNKKIIEKNKKTYEKSWRKIEENVFAEMENIVDWMPDHDFVPFSPNCGRTFGISVNGSAYPFYTHDGAAYGIPYIKPFAPMSDWTNIPEKGTYDISIFCLQWTTNLFKTLGELNGRELQIRDIIGSGPARVTIPIAVGHKKFLEQLDRPVVDYLKSIYEHGILHLD